MPTNLETTRSHVGQVLATLGEALGIDLALDSDDACYFEHADGWRMAILYPGEDQIVTAVSVMSGVTATDEEVWPVLVDLGWIGAQTDGAALSWNPESRSFVLWHSRDALSTTPEELNELLLRLCRVVTEVRPEVSDRLFAPTADDERQGEASPMFRV